jgi:hypothetical protein
MSSTDPKNVLTSAPGGRSELQPVPGAPLTRPSGESPPDDTASKRPAAPPAPTPVALQPHAAIGFAASTNAYLLDYIKFGDAKAGAILTLAGVIGGGIASLAPKTLADALAVSHWLALGVALTLAAALIFAVTIAVYCARALAPQTPTAGSLHSFPDIGRMTLEQYASGVDKLTEESATREFINHNWTLSRVASTKFNAIALAIRFIPWMIAAGALYAGLAVTVWALQARYPITALP